MVWRKETRQFVGRLRLGNETTFPGSACPEAMFSNKAAAILERGVRATTDFVIFDWPDDPENFERFEADHLISIELDAERAAPKGVSMRQEE